MRLEARFVSRRKAVKWCKDMGLKGRVFKKSDNGRWWEVINPYASESGRDDATASNIRSHTGKLPSKMGKSERGKAKGTYKRKPAKKRHGPVKRVYDTSSETDAETGIRVNPKTGEYERVTI